MKKANSTRSTQRLKDIYKNVGTLITQPLTFDQKMAAQTTDGADTAKLAEQYISANDRLSAFERIELYNRQYWFRLIDILYDDFPGLRAVVGEKPFYDLVEAYLIKYPSRSYSLRDLGCHLVAFITEQPKYLGKRKAMAIEMARFEWAQIHAFDTVQHPTIEDQDIVQKDPQTLTFTLQPYISLLELSYAFDDFVLALKRSVAERSEASALAPRKKKRSSRIVTMPKRQKLYMVVHRFENVLYYKRLTKPAFALLTALRNGMPLGPACESIYSLLPKRQQKVETAQQLIQSWFQTWRKLGWLCKSDSNVSKK